MSKISLISSTKIKFFYTKFTPRGKISIQKFCACIKSFFFTPCVCVKYPTNANYKLPKMAHRGSAYKNEIVQSNTICPDNNKLKQHINHRVNL